VSKASRNGRPLGPCRPAHRPALEHVCQEASCRTSVNAFASGTATFLMHAGRAATRAALLRTSTFEHRGSCARLDASEPLRRGEAGWARLGLSHVGDHLGQSRRRSTTGGQASFVACISRCARAPPAPPLSFAVPRFRAAKLGRPCRREAGRAGCAATNNIETGAQALPAGADPRGSYHAPWNCCKRCAKAGPRAYTKSGVMVGWRRRTRRC